VFTQVLGNQNDTLVFSEVNPHYRYAQWLKQQADEWYGIPTTHRTFKENVHYILSEIAAEKQVIFRDFSFIDFTPNKLNCYYPTNAFSILSQLPEHTIPFALIRHPLAVWISRGCPPHFFEHYFQYLKALKKLQVPVFTYEAFCVDPSQVLKELHQKTGLRISEKILQGFGNNTHITGDAHVVSATPSNHNKIAIPSEKRVLHGCIKHLKSNTAYIACCEVFDYPVTWPSLYFPWHLNFYKLHFKKWLGKYPPHPY
jgi:hypothetical protein